MSAPASRRISNLTIALACLAFFGGMIGMSYAAVPLYQLFCQVTGYGGTTQRVEQASAIILDRRIKVRFDANVSPGLAFEFAPVEREVDLRIGETAEVLFRAKNIGATDATGRATFNVAPHYAGSYFNKIACFCFTDTTLKPGESIDMPVQFFVDPAIVDTTELRDVRTITLSYTFFPAERPKPVAALGARSDSDMNEGG